MLTTGEPRRLFEDCYLRIAAGWASKYFAQATSLLLDNSLNWRIIVKLILVYGIIYLPSLTLPHFELHPLHALSDSHSCTCSSDINTMNLPTCIIFIYLQLFVFLIYVDLSRENLVGLAVLLGCDYLPQGVPQVGKIKAMELIQNIKPDNLVQR